jgi:hypothetical protein
MLRYSAEPVKNADVAENASMRDAPDNYTTVILGRQDRGDDFDGYWCGCSMARLQRRIPIGPADLINVVVPAPLPQFILNFL